MPSTEKPVALEPRLSRKEVAKLLSVTTRTVQRWEEAGLLVPEYINSRVIRYRQSNVLSLISSEKPTEPAA